MKGASGIEWSDRTWAVVTGCTKTSSGCRDCWAKAEVDSRWSKNPRSVWFGREFADVRLHPEQLTQPAKERTGRRIFVCPRSDLFHESVPFEFIAAVFGAMGIAPQHTFQVLTKRAGRMRAFFEWIEHEGRRGPPGASPWTLCTMKLLTSGADLRHCWPDKLDSVRPWPLPNIWLGVSAEDQDNLAARLPDLLACPADLRWLSLEPLVGEIDLRHVRCRTWNFVDRSTCLPSELSAGPPEVAIDALSGCVRDGKGAHASRTAARIGWVVVGGEAGKRARPMQTSWVRSIREQCEQGPVPFFMKQWGDWVPRDQWYGPVSDVYPSVTQLHVGKRRAGALLDGQAYRALPLSPGVPAAAVERRADHGQP